MMGAQVDTVETRRSRLSEPCDHRLVETPDVLLARKATRDNRLVCDHHEGISGAGESGERGRDAGEHGDIGWTHERIDILDEDAIPIEEYRSSPAHAP